MKKLTLLALVLFIGVAKLQAQVTVSPGLKGGINISDLENFESGKQKTDFYAGGFIAIKFNQTLTLQPELIYSRQGAEVRNYDPETNIPRRADYNINYLAMGAVAKYHFNGKGFHILGGLSVDIKTDDNFPKYEYSTAGVDLSVIGGLGYSLPNGITFEARLKQGLVDIYGYEGLDYNYDSNEIILNRVIQLGISYTFKLK